MRWSTGAVLAGLVVVAACKGADQPGAAAPPAEPPAQVDVQPLVSAAAAPPGSMLDESGDPEDGDLVGTELHGDHAEVAAGSAQPRDLPRLYPAAYEKWLTNVARASTDDRDWVESLDSTGTRLQAVTVGGVPYIKGWVCERHNCAGNELVFLMTPDQSQMIGYLRLAFENGNVVERGIGPVKPDQLRCMRRFMDDVSGVTSC